MIENQTIQLAEIPLGGKDGFAWNLLHGEREEICEALLRPGEATRTAPERQQLLQERLRSIDDALDRLMSASVH